jgi:hypothetical protein
MQYFLNLDHAQGLMDGEGDIQMLKDRYPATWELLAERNCLMLAEEFLQEVTEVKDVDTANLLTFFPIYLRKRGVNRDLVEFSHWEYVNKWVREVDLGEVKDKTITQVNPSAQFVELSEGSSLLDRAPGIYALWRDRNGKPRELQLTLAQARALDQLSEGMVMQDQDLMEIMEELKKLDLVLGPQASQTLHNSQGGQK